MSLLYDHADGVATLTLNRPDKLNAIDRSLHDALIDALARVSAEDARVVVLQGAGRAFSAGGDLTAVAAGHDVGDPSDLEATLRALPMPIIAAVHGYCLGQAFELVQLCDLAVATEGARFGEVEVAHGWGPPLDVTARTLARKHAMEVLLLGEVFSAEDALRMGVVNRVVAESELVTAVSAMTERIKSLDGGVLVANKALVRGVGGVE